MDDGRAGRAGSRRGRLRIYLGAAPGVGKTVAMLAEGARRRERGTDVVIGLVETHGRPFTAQQAQGLELVPRRETTHRGAALTEMDLDAVLARRPEVALVDELAHTNVPGSRNEKRWQDIDELLAAGIDVISTVNIQHLESLNDVVESITGITQKETVPDQVVRGADQIDLVDMSPEALRRRMAHGNVYAAEKVDAALANYFRVGNLSALRELALLWLADRVEQGIERYRADHGIAATWQTRERVLVAVSGGPEGEALLRRGSRIASRGAGGELHAVYVARSDGLAGPGLAAVARLRRLAEELGGTFHSVTGDDPGAAILEFARGINASQIIIGSRHRPLWKRLLGRGIGETVISGAGEIDVHVVTHPQPGAGFRALVRDALPRHRIVSGYALAVVLPTVLTILFLLAHLTPGLSLIVPLYLFAAVVVALVGGLGPAVLAAVFASLLLNWFFSPPVGTLTIADPEHAATLVLFVVVAVIVSVLVHRNMRRTAVAVAAQNESAALAELTNVLLGSTDQLGLLLDRAVEMFGVRGAAVVRRGEDGAPPTVVAASPGFDPALLADVDHEAADEHHDLVLQPSGVQASLRRLVAAYAVHAGAILQRRALQASASSAEALARDNRARTALLSAVSHDLRTPLAGIKAAIASLRNPDITWDPKDEAELEASIEESADRLDALVGNLLDMSRLQAGALAVKPRRIDLGELLPATVASLTAPERVEWSVTPGARSVVADPGLLDRVVGNVAENALRQQADGTVGVRAERVGDTVEVRIVDTGPGVPLAVRERIFLPFQRHGDAHGGGGIGLGLAVARGFAEAMGGSLVAEDTPGGGLTMVLTLPRHEGQIITVPTLPEDAE